LLSSKEADPFIVPRNRPARTAITTIIIFMALHRLNGRPSPCHSFIGIPYHHIFGKQFKGKLSSKKREYLHKYKIFFF